MKKVYSKEVKSEIFETLHNEHRFQCILEKVINKLKLGHEPVVIESWSSHFRKIKAYDVFWSWVLTAKEYDYLLTLWDDNGIDIKSCAQLNAESETPFRGEDILLTIVVTQRHKELFRKSTTMPKNMATCLIYYGYRDMNYFKHYFTSLGYEVTEGNVGDKYGLLISLGK
jgi:hypothetical protein